MALERILQNPEQLTISDIEPLLKDPNFMKFDQDERMRIIIDVVERANRIEAEREKKLLEEAYSGDASAQYKIGLKYLTINKKEADTWFEKAAKQLHIPAIYQLGKLRESIEIITFAAELGDQDAKELKAEMEREKSEFKAATILLSSHHATQFGKVSTAPIVSEIKDHSPTQSRR
jgi:hypothetical protein